MTSTATLLTGATLVSAAGAVAEGWLLLADGVIAATGTGSSGAAVARLAVGEGTPLTVVDVNGGIVTPGMIDLHCHGGGGADVLDGPDAIAQAVAAHRGRGVTGSVLSVVTSDPADELRALAEIADACDRVPGVLGSHLEGPFLAPARRGAHDPARLAIPDAARIEAQLAAARGTLRQVTIAPELPGALEAIRQYRAAGVVVAVGHTEAGYEQARAAFDAGATLLTHTFNAMPGLGHREPGPIAAAIEDDRVTLEVIWDGLHVADAMAGLLLRAAPGRVAFVSDAMSAACAHDGDYLLGGLPVTVQDRAARLTESGALAGSTLTLDRAVARAVGFGIDPASAVAAATATPARVLGGAAGPVVLSAGAGTFEVGAQADVLLFGADWAVQGVWQTGVRVDGADDS